MKHAFKAITPLLGLLLLAALYCPLPGCAGGSDVGNPQCKTFTSDDALLAYFVDQFAQSVLPESIYTGIKDDAGVAPSFSAEADYSRTNVQETGVDEADTVKTDGRHLFVAGESCVYIVDTAFDGDMRQISRVDVDGFVDSLYLSSGALIILYRPTDGNGGNGGNWPGEDDADARAIDIGMPYWIPAGARFGVLISDISDPQNPRTLNDIQADGDLAASRLINGRLHLVSRFFPEIPTLDIWYDGSETDRSDTANANAEKLSSLTLDEFIPAYEARGESGVITNKGRLVATQDFIRPEIPGGGTTVVITTIDLENPAGDFASVGFIADVHHVYASVDALYLVSSVYSDDFETPDADIRTRIYQFSLSGATAEYIAVGSVRGRILNQFSLGEYNDVLRIATGTGNTWDGSAENHVFCLEKQNADLEIIGRLEGLATGERLYASRFIGDKGFLVTFVEVDPLFTLDLSDPRNPAVAGELKVPGVSTYLHPIGDHLLLTVGKDAVLDGDSVYYQGVQLSLFDIGDFSHPRLIDTRKIGDRGTESEALSNHKALTFLPADNLLALPVTLHEHLSPPPGPWEYGTRTFDGVYVFQVTGDDLFAYKGRIDLISKSYDDFSRPGWMRGLFIGPDIYAISPDIIKTTVWDAMATDFDALDLLP